MLHLHILAAGSVFFVAFCDLSLIKGESDRVMTVTDSSRVDGVVWVYLAVFVVSNQNLNC